MAIERQIKLSFHGIDIIETNFNCQKQFSFEEEIVLNTDVKLIKNNSNEQNFRILMQVNLIANNYFTLFVKAIGHFEFHGEIENTEKKGLININAPAIMFPYIRSFISLMTANFGNSISTIVVPPQFFKVEELEEIDI